MHKTDRHFIMHHVKVYIPPDTRTCNIHLNRLNWNSCDIPGDSNDFKKEHIEDMFNILTDHTLNERVPVLSSEFFSLKCSSLNVLKLCQ